MSFPGDLFSSVNRIGSQAKMNLKCNLVGTGDQILAKSPGSLQVGMIASVTADSAGGSLKAGIHKWDGTSWVSPQGGIHTHASASDGGSFQNMLLSAIQNIWFANHESVTVDMFKTTGTGATYSNVVSDTNTYVEISTGTTTDNAGNLRYGGLIYTFTQPSAFVTRVQLASATTNSQARVGMNMEGADYITDNKPKYGFEGCASCNSSSMSIVSADGTNRSKNTTSTDNYSVIGNYMMKLDPGINVKYRKENGTIITKTGNIPSTGICDRSNAWITGIQVTGGGATKSLRLAGFKAIATIGETWPTI
jgi:hypothetical protein